LTTDHERQAREFLDAAEEIGANFFDHANIYGRGRAEEVFGRVLKERPSLRDEGRLAPSLESSGPGEIDGEVRRPAREHKEDRRFSAGLRPTPQDDCRGHPAGLASQTPGEDSARVGNNPPGPIAGVQQGGFGFLKPGGMVFTFRRGQRGTHALKGNFSGRLDRMRLNRQVFDLWPDDPLVVNIA
jgi:hypothetical protein